MPQPQKRRIVTRDDGTVWIGKRNQWYRYGPGPWCGTVVGYSKHACRCPECKSAQQIKAAQYRASLSGQRTRNKYRKRRDSAIKSLNEILAIADQVIANEITAEQAIHTIVKTYG